LRGDSGEFANGAPQSIINVTFERFWQLFNVDESITVDDESLEYNGISIKTIIISIFRHYSIRARKQFQLVEENYKKLNTMEAQTHCNSTLVPELKRHC